MEAAAPQRSAEGEGVRIVSWNVHSWSDNKFRKSFDSILQELRGLAPDILVLNEATHPRSAAQCSQGTSPADMRKDPKDYSSSRAIAGLYNGDSKFNSSSTSQIFHYTQKQNAEEEPAVNPRAYDTYLERISVALDLPHWLFSEATALGNAVLSRWPLERSQALVMPCLDLGGHYHETRSCIATSISVPTKKGGAQPINLFATHLDQRSEEARMIQIQKCFQFINSFQSSSASNSVSLLVGDLNAFTKEDCSEAHWSAIVHHFNTHGWTLPEDRVIPFIKSQGFVDCFSSSPSCASSSASSKQSVAGDDFDDGEEQDEEKSMAMSEVDKAKCSVWTGRPLLRIDHAFASNNAHERLVIRSCEVVQSCVASDHYPLLLRLKQN
ncbi:hypothetical protein QOT17_000744 [Balamuthia mandrillaris]